MEVKEAIVDMIGQNGESYTYNFKGGKHLAWYLI